MNIKKTVILLVAFLMAACGSESVSKPRFSVNGGEVISVCENESDATVLLVSNDQRKFIQCVPFMTTKDEPIGLQIPLEPDVLPEADWQSFKAWVYIPFEYQRETYDIRGICQSICSGILIYGQDSEILYKFNNDIPDVEFGWWIVDLTKAAPGTGAVVVSYENWGDETRFSIALRRHY